MSGRMTFLHRADGVSPHTVAEVQLEGDWRVRDVFFGFAPTRARTGPGPPCGISLSGLSCSPRAACPSSGTRTRRFSWSVAPRVVVRATPRGRSSGRRSCAAWPLSPRAGPRIASRISTFCSRPRRWRIRASRAIPRRPPLLSRSPSPRAPAGPGSGSGIRSSCDATPSIRRPIMWSITSGCSSSASCRARRPRSGRSRAARTLPPDGLAGEVKYLLARAHAAANHCAAAAALYGRVIDSDGGGREDATSGFAVSPAPDRAQRRPRPRSHAPARSPAARHRDAPPVAVSKTIRAAFSSP